MFKVERKEFKPMEEHQDLVIRFLTPSYSAKMKAMAALKDVPSDGPGGDRFKDFQGMLPYMYELVRACVKEVEGLEVDGEEIKTGDALIDKGPEEVVFPFMMHLMALASVREDAKKN